MSASSGCLRATTGASTLLAIDDVKSRASDFRTSDIRCIERDRLRAIPLFLYRGVKAIGDRLRMTTDPGDLVLDPTCGSGTTAHVAEQWGRRWITCDTSRVALAIARQRLMTQVYDYYGSYTEKYQSPDDRPSYRRPFPVSHSRRRIIRALSSASVATQVSCIEAMEPSHRSTSRRRCIDRLTTRHLQSEELATGIEVSLRTGRVWLAGFERMRDPPRRCRPAPAEAEPS